MSDQSVQNAWSLINQTPKEVWFKIDSVDNDDIKMINQINPSLNATKKNIESCLDISPTIIQTCVIKINGELPSKKSIDQYISFLNNYEKKLTSYALKKLQEIPNIKIYGNPEKRGGVISFNIKGIHPQDLSQFLNEDNICLRVGHHCAQPLLKTLNETSTARVSFYIYNDFSDIDKLVDSINSTISYF